ncbi:MAG: MFS transporter [Sphingomicrobium sp.]
MASEAERRTGAGAAAGTGMALTLSLSLLVLFNYMDRGALAIAAPGLKTELALTATGFGLAVSAFAWVYAPAQFFVGWLTDRFCVYRLVAAGLALWALATVTTSFVGGLSALVGLRIMLGIGEGVAFPAASKIIAAKVAGKHRGIANSAVASALYFGPALGIFAGGLIMLHWGWRAVFLVFGLATLVWLVPWLLVSKPHWHERTTAAERIPLGQVLRQRAVWAMGVGHFTNTYAFFFLLAWLPLFLVKTRGLSLIEMTRLLTIVYLVQAASALLLGWLSDRLVARGTDEGRLRKGLMAAAHLFTGIAVLGLAGATDTAHIGFWLLFAAVAGGPAGSNVYAIAQMFAGPRAAGSWVGVVNGVGNSSGIFGPILTGLIIDSTGSYSWAFYIAAGLSLAGALWWTFAIPQVRPVVFPERKVESGSIHFGPV